MTISIPSTKHPDVLLIGAGILSATLAVIRERLDPTMKIEIYRSPRKRGQAHAVRGVATPPQL